MEAMLEACAFLDDTTDAKRRICESDGQMRLVHKLMTDIIECYHFVRKYASKKFGSVFYIYLPFDAFLNVFQYHTLLVTFAPTYRTTYRDTRINSKSSRVTGAFE